MLPTLEAFLLGEKKTVDTKRKIYIIGEIDQVAFATFTEQLDALLDEHPTKPIEVELCSGGGEEGAAFAIYGKMNASTAPINITAYGEVQSAAVIILAAGDHRVINAETVLMVHQSSAEFEGSVKYLKVEMDELQRAEHQFCDALACHTHLSSNEWYALSKDTTYFTATTAVYYGLADAVKQPNGIKNRKGGKKKHGNKN